jgi:hypothetical protein
MQSINSLRAYRVYEIKIDWFHNSEPEERLCIMFLEAKLLYNHVLYQDNIFNLDFDIPISSLNSGISIIFER